MYYGYGYMDLSYLLVIIGIIVSLILSGVMKSTYKKYDKVKSISGMTGVQAAETILRYAGIHHVKIEHVPGELTDAYDTNSQTMYLSDSTYYSTSVAALGVAAHECGHVIQHNEGYSPLMLKRVIQPAAGFGARFAMIPVLAGLFIPGGSFLITIGIWLFTAVVIFQLLALPVEYNASKRAAKILESYGILHGNELGMCKKVLGAAALTYVAAAAVSALQLLRLVGLGNRR